MIQHPVNLADLFVARIIYCLEKNGRCGLVLPDGLLFNSDNSKVNLKKKLMTECNLHTIIRLPSSVFAPYTSINTNLLFFDKTGKTEETWFYRMDMPEGVKHFNKTNPIKREDMKCIDEWWNNRVEIADEKESETSTQTFKAKNILLQKLKNVDLILICVDIQKKKMQFLLQKKQLKITKNAVKVSKKA